MICFFFLRLFGYELSTQWNLQWSASCFFLEVGLGDRARPGQWINGGIKKKPRMLAQLWGAMPAWGHLFVELEPLLPVLICFQGVGIPHHHPGEIRVGKMRQVKRADSKTRKGRKKQYIDMLSCKLSQKSTEGANFRYLRCLICGWITWTISKGHTCQNYGAAACSSYISPDGQSLNLGPSHIPRRARVSITFNRRQSAKKPTLPILFKPWWTWLANAELVQVILGYHFGHHKCWEISFWWGVIKSCMANVVHIGLDILQPYRL